MVVFWLWQCQPLGEDSLSEIHSIRAGNDALKIAVNYIGDTHCRDESAISANKMRVSNPNSHLLSGKNGELISDEFKEVRKQQGRSNWQSLQFSGDRFFGKTKSSTLTMEQIKAKCRRLILSIDSQSVPTLTFGSGFALRNQREAFQAIALSEFGALNCLDNAPFCNFANIHDGKDTLI